MLLYRGNNLLLFCFYPLLIFTLLHDAYFAESALFMISLVHYIIKCVLEGGPQRRMTPFRAELSDTTFGLRYDGKNCGTSHDSTKQLRNV